MRRIAIIGGIIVLALIGFFVIRQQRQASEENQLEILREATVEQGEVTATVNAVGSIEPEALVSLTFGLSGTIQQVNIVRGQAVAVGDVLATLNTDELALAVQQAEDALLIQELTLQQRLDSEPTAATLASAEADIAAAEANLAVAEANLASAEAAVLQAEAQKAQLLAGPTPGQVAQAEANVAAAELAQKNAQDAYDQTVECFEDPAGNEVCPGLGAPEEAARAALQNANASLVAAQAALQDVRTSARPADIQLADAAIANAEAGVQAAQGNVQAAEANLARAVAAYDRLLEPPSDNEIAVLEAQVAAAQTNLDLAELRLEQSQIVAPIAGTVANVIINEGEIASPGAPAITVVNEEAFHITVSVDEIDIDEIALGQEVAVSVDALPDTAVTGTISEIAPTSATSGGVVTYLVTINIDSAQSDALRPGMSANASIVVDEVADVLVVPNWAIRLNRETGEAFVNLQQADGTIEEVVIETGLRNEQFSEVLAGLDVGDTVVLTNDREGFSLFGSEE
ncbi:efflux RND transporter periplasmic adaptor subunit [Candidatus Leptofilum sp.]|uniref:efflux RND transporter periplasmic adaptor subunit n=1 Tax=Candidatus Leptofilum sp. TaxID=3241576 RepID=UPI003B5AAD88